jgi:hypothetical protein
MSPAQRTFSSRVLAVPLPDDAIIQRWTTRFV